MKVLLFPGQGAQFRGMGSGLWSAYRDIADAASQLLGYSIEELCLQDQRDQLRFTQYAQPALYVVNALNYYRWLEAGVVPDALAGHSLGEYSALLAASAFDFETGLRLVQRRGELMGQARGGTMAAVLGLPANELRAMLDEHALKDIELANFNSPTQIVIAGEVQAIESAEHLLSKQQVRCVKLNVSAAFHSCLMRPAQKQFTAFLRQFNLSDPLVPVIANATAQPYAPGNVAELLARQIASPVRWSESIEHLLGQDDFEYVEIGADPARLGGVVLGKMVNEIREAFRASQPRQAQTSGSVRAQEPRKPEKKTAAQTTLHAAQPRARADEPIAVIGMSGCFPQAPDIDTFWKNLCTGRDSVTELPADRWGSGSEPRIRHAGVLDEIAEFDPMFFGISPREARAMDPQQRLLMTHVYKVIEDAGYSVASLSGSNTALLAGIVMSGYQSMLEDSAEEVAGWSTAGVVGSIGPNRMSYWLNWHGPSEPVETACSSGLIAVHRAVQLLRSGQCDQAVAGAVNGLMSMTWQNSFAEAGMLSVTGRCKAFSAHADGYVRAEGVGMLMLKRLSAAERDGDHIYGLILGSAQNHGGRAKSLTSPNPFSQAQVIASALRDASIDLSTVGYIETHGTGTPLGDPIEIHGLKAALGLLCGDRKLPEGTIGLGTVKSNVGHLEVAAGVAGLIKTLLQLRHGELVRTLHSEPPNPRIDLRGSPFYVVTQNQAWTPLSDEQGRVLPRRAGVSSFGFGGVNAHIVLQEYVAPVRAATSALKEAIVVLSARTAGELQAQVQQLLAHLQTRDEVLTDLAYTLQVGREALGVRLAMVVSSTAALKTVLTGLIEGASALERVWRGKVEDIHRHSLAPHDADSRKVDLGEGGTGSSYDEIAQSWVRGGEVFWGGLYGSCIPHRISLPTYPFSRERFWVSQHSLGAGKSRVASADDNDASSGVSAASASVPTATASDLIASGSTLVNAGSGFNSSGRGYRDELKGLTLAQCVELDLAEYVRALFQIPRETFHTNTNLADYGVDSIGLIKLAGQLTRHFGLEIKPSLFFSFTTLKQFAAHLAGTHEAILAAFYGATVKGAAHHDNRRTDRGPLPRSSDARSTDRDTRPLDVSRAAEPIAIIGMSGRFPGARTVDDLWTILSEGMQTVELMPRERGAGSQSSKYEDLYLGMVAGVDEFDPLFFEISPRDAALMDPRQRLLLQESWRALEDAGYGSEQLRRDTIGMFVGIDQGDYHLLPGVPSMSSVNHDAVLAARLAYILDLHGPVMALNTACSSGLVAAHQACSSIRAGECDVAIAGAVSLSLSKTPLVAMQQAGMLSPDGRCYAFDQRANGMVTGEAVVAVVFKQLSRALADGDPIHAIVMGSGINYDGKTSGITAPSGAAQTRLVETVYERYRIDPEEIDYVIAHGTGTPLGDPIEINALSDAFRKRTQLKGYCALTSVKPNLGHTMAAAGLVNLVSLVQAMRHQTIPASLNCEQPSDYMGWSDSPFYVNTSAKPWSSCEDGRRTGAISAFGISGTNAHMVIEEYVHPFAEPAPRSPVALLVLSAKSEEALRTRASDMVKLLLAREWDHESLAAVGHTLLNGRQHFKHRCAVVGRDKDDVIRKLAMFASRERHPHLVTGEAARDIAPPELLRRYGEELLRRVSTHECDAEQEYQSLLALADMYCRSYELDWIRLFGDHPPRRVALPGYPFARDRYWANTAETVTPCTDDEPVQAEPFAIPAVASGESQQSSTRDTVRTMLAKIVGLDVSQLQDDEPILSYGLDSINSAHLIEEINRKTGLKLSFTALFEHRTIDALVAHLDKKALYVRLSEVPGRESTNKVKLHDAAVSDGSKPVRPTITDAVQQKPQQERERERSCTEATDDTHSRPQESEPIAVIGMSGRFPGADNVNRYWDNLLEGRDCITEVPHHRWSLDGFYTSGRDEAIRDGRSYSKWGGFISSSRAPVSTKLADKLAKLEFPLTDEQGLFFSTVETLLDSAGYSEARLRSTAQYRTGLFVGMLHASDQPSSVLASFASRVFGFNGPSLAVDTHSASSMTALHMACSALNARDCDMAISGGVAYLRPEMYLTACRLGMLGDDLHSRSLSEHRNGAIFADGVGAVLLKRLSDAVHAGDEILAVIRSTVSSYVGSIELSNVPAPELIERSIRDNFIRSRIDPRTIGHLEAAAAGYKLADPLEIQATTRAFRSFTPDRQFCTLGSLKRTIGHATAASGVHQLIKVIQQLRHGKTAPFFEVSSLDPNIDLEDSPFRVPSTEQLWERPNLEGSINDQNHPRRAMINSLGFGGFYAGAIVEEYVCGPV